MTNPTYTINIHYQPSVLNGQQLIYSGSASVGTYSIATYTDSYFIASMPEISLYATGSSYTASLANLLALASSAPNPEQPPLNNQRTW